MKAGLGFLLSCFRITIMHPEDLKKSLRASPFRPFTLYLPNEKSFRVPHEDFAWLTPSGRTLVVAVTEHAGVDLLDTAMITRIEAQEAPHEK